MTFSEMINSDKPVLVDFFAEWCGPCKTMAPILKQVKDEVQDNASIIKIDVDRNQHTASTYQVNSVPTLMLFKQGKVLWRQSGVLPKNELVKKIKQYF
jgi:thioredoxin 1